MPITALGALGREGGFWEGQDLKIDLKHVGKGILEDCAILQGKAVGWGGAGQGIWGPRHQEEGRDTEEIETLRR